jgi:ribonuclease HI
VPRKQTVLYTDGACSGNPGPGGWGSIVLTPDGNVRELGGGDPSTTNNRMEMTAALRGLENLTVAEKSVILYTDSVYLIRGITQWVFGWQRRQWKTAEGQPVVNQDLWQRLLSIVSKIGRERIQWNFVRGHVGVPGNERCDAIAVAFSKGQAIPLYQGPMAEYSIPIDELPEPLPLPEIKAKGPPKVAHSYLSLVGGVVERHKTWSECEARVKGRSGAKFKKAMSPEEEQTILAEWGF